MQDLIPGLQRWRARGEAIALNRQLARMGANFIRVDSRSFAVRDLRE